MHMLIDQIKPHDIWQHYKGGHYRIIALSCHSEDLTWYVVYETLYDNNISRIWHRPLEIFLGTLELDGQTIPRFVRKNESPTFPKQ